MGRSVNWLVGSLAARSDREVDSVALLSMAGWSRGEVGEALGAKQQRIQETVKRARDTLRLAAPDGEVVAA